MKMTFERDTEQGWAVLTKCSECSEADVIQIPADVLIDHELLPVCVIGPQAFQDCTAKCIVLPMSIVEIKDYAFKSASAHCIGVVEDSHHSVLPLMLTKIGKESFSETHLQDVTFTHPTIALGDSAFQDSSVCSVFFPRTIDLNLNTCAFENSKLRDFIAPKLTSLEVPERCFANCPEFNHFHIGDGKVSLIEKEAFLNCEKLLDLPTKQPLDVIGLNAFSGSSVSTSGMFRNLIGYYQAFGSKHLSESVLEILVPYYRKIFSIEYLQARAEKIRQVTKTVLTELLAVESEETDLGLIYAAVKNWQNVCSADNMINHIGIYEKSDILQKFRRIIAFDLTDGWKLEDMLHPPFHSLADLKESEIFNLLQYEVSPKPVRYTTRQLLNAELLGSAFDFPDQVAMDFLVQQVEERLDSVRITDTVSFNITNNEIRRFFFQSYDELFAQAGTIPVLRDILFNRLSIYEQLLYAHLQLTP